MFLMGLNVYVDTCIFLNIFKEERRFNQYEFSFEFFKRIKQENCTLLISDWLEEQIKIKGFQKDFNDFIATFPNVRKLNVTEEIKAGDSTRPSIRDASPGDSGDGVSGSTGTREITPADDDDIDGDD